MRIVAEKRPPGMWRAVGATLGSSGLQGGVRLGPRTVAVVSDPGAATMFEDAHSMRLVRAYVEGHAASWPEYEAEGCCLVYDD